jgi:hypothetical protein
MIHSSKAKTLLAQFRYRFADRLDKHSFAVQDDGEPEEGYATIQAIIDGLRERGEASNLGKTPAELKLLAQIAQLKAALQVPEEFIGNGSAAAQGLEVFGCDLDIAQCEALLKEREADDNSVVASEVKAESEFSGEGGVFSEELFKRNSPHYLQLASSPEQQEALLEMYRAVRQKRSLRVLVHGGPGTGKTYFMSVLQDALASLNVRLLVMAPSGVAAAIHSTGPLFSHN